MKYRFRMIVKLGILKVTPYVTNVDEGKKDAIIEASETLDALLGGSLLRYLKLEFEPLVKK